MTTRRALAPISLGILSTALTACNSPAGIMPTAPAAVNLPLTPPATPPLAPSTGTSRLFGTVTERTAKGLVPVAGVHIEYCGYDSAETAANGSYELYVPNGMAMLFVHKTSGFKEVAPVTTVSGATQFDFQLERE